MEALERIGAKVRRLNDPHLGDLLIGFRYRLMILECKSKGGKLEPGQQEFHQEFVGFPVGVAYTPEEAVRFVTQGYL